MAPAIPLLSVLVSVSHAKTCDVTEEVSMLQKITAKTVSTDQDEDASECRCPGYFQEQCESEPAQAQGCFWSNDGESNAPWCQCGPAPDPPLDVEQSEVKGPCPDYFGNVDGGIVTVADPDVGHTPASSVYCDYYGMPSPCIYMHLAGAANVCESPAPPDGCHRYHTVKYSECAALESFNFDGRIDTTGAFNTDGVFVDCLDQVISNEVACYGPPHDLPVACDCATAGPVSTEEEPEPEVKGPCSDYFGDVDGGIVTVADPDVGHTPASSVYCDYYGMPSPCIYMHLAGAANVCESPAPPDGCHRYHTVKYSECAALENFNFDGRIDTTGAFDTDGVFVDCLDQVISNEVACYGPPADLPVACDCDTAGP